MSIKTKLMTAIMSLVLVLGLLSVGVYALNQAEVTLGGNLTFSATGVYAQVTGSVEGAVVDEANKTYETLLFSTDNPEPDPTSWQKNLGFNGTSDIVLTINIQNLATDRPLYAMITDTITEEVANVTKTVKQGEEDCLGECIEVPANTTKTIVITMELKNENLSLEGAKYGYKIELNKDFIETVYSLEQWKDTSLVGEGNALSFTIADGEATVSMLNETDTKGDIVIPSHILDENGESVPVTKVGSFMYLGEYGQPIGTAITSVQLPKTIKTIAGFSYCDQLKVINIPSSVVSIGSSTFDGCYAIEKVIIEDINKYAEIERGDYKSSPFADNSAGLYYANDPETLVTDVVLTTATKIESAAFCGMDITSITIPDSVKSIGRNAFSYSKITSVVIPDGITSIEQEAFAYNSKLTSVTIPDSVQTIGDSVFNGCSALESITVKATTPPTLGTKALYNVPEICPIYVPSESVDAYKAADGWKDRAGYIQAING